MTITDASASIATLLQTLTFEEFQQLDSAGTQKLDLASLQSAYPKLPAADAQNIAAMSSITFKTDAKRKQTIVAAMFEEAPTPPETRPAQHAISGMIDSRGSMAVNTQSKTPNPKQAPRVIPAPSVPARAAAAPILPTREGSTGLPTGQPAPAASPQ